MLWPLLQVGAVPVVGQTVGLLMAEDRMVAQPHKILAASILEVEEVLKQLVVLVAPHLTSIL
jgi:hypothetical protein